MLSLRLFYQRYTALMDRANRVRDPVEKKSLIRQANGVLNHWFNLVEREVDDRMARSK